MNGTKQLSEAAGAVQVGKLVGNLTVINHFSTPSRLAATTNAQQHPDLALWHEATLDCLVPAMQEGFLIITRHGHKSIEPGQLADRIRDLVAQDARLQLMRLEVAALDQLEGEAP